MLNSKKYSIQFAGLSLGEHQYELTVDDEFFEETDFPEIKQGNITVDLTLLKRSNMMVLDFVLKGFVKTTCDRCADEFDLPVSGEYKLIVKVGAGDVGNDDDDIIEVSATESKLDLSTYLYEYVMLALPAKREHENPEDCDKEVISKLNNIIVEEEKEEETDPRWEELKKIKLN